MADAPWEVLGWLLLLVVVVPVAVGAFVYLVLTFWHRREASDG